MRDRASIVPLPPGDGSVAFVWALLQQPELAWANCSSNWASAMLGHPATIAAAAKFADRHVGFFLAHPTLQRHAYECHAAFEPEYRRASLLLARMAMAHLLERVPKHVTTVYAYIPSTNAPANIMARAAGMKLVGTIQDWFPMADGSVLPVNVHAIYRRSITT